MATRRLLAVVKFISHSLGSFSSFYSPLHASTTATHFPLSTPTADSDLAMHRVHSNVSMEGLQDAFSDASEEPMFRMD